MDELSLQLTLQEPFNERQCSVTLGGVTWLVGPNGSGKTRFANALIASLGGYSACRLLKADRLAGLEIHRSGYFSSGQFNQGFAKNSFNDLKSQAAQFGYGADAIVLLEEDRALRAIVEATLSQIFERRVLFEWDSGILQPRVLPRGKSGAYSLHQDECHGLKELVVLLTHINDRSKKVLIVDEPELNLHPQYQTFILGHFRDAAKTLQKRIVLITHSPYMMSLRNIEDLKYLYSFNGDGSLPRRFSDLDGINPVTAQRCIAQMNAHHRQVFFSRYVVLVEGVYDRLIVASLLERMQRSIAAAGGTIVDVNGKEDIPFYFRLCESLGKCAYVLADLDALFDGSVRRVLGKDEALSSALATSGGGTDINAYIGFIQRELHEIHDKLLTDAEGHTSLSKAAKECLKDSKCNDPKVERYLAKLVLTAEEREFPSFVLETVRSAQGRLSTILKAFEEGLGVFFLRKGEIEDYLVEDYLSRREYSSRDKQEIVSSSLRLLQEGADDPLVRFPGLNDFLDIINNFPHRTAVDYWVPLTELGQEVVQVIQRFASSGELLNIEDVRRLMSEKFKNVTSVVECSGFGCEPLNSSGPRQYSGRLTFTFQGETRTILFDQDTPVYKAVPSPSV